MPARPALVVAILLAVFAWASPAAASFINYSSREINVKIVYVGPTAAGRDSLQYIYGKLDPKSKGKLIKLATETESTWFFDFLPLDLGEIRGFKTRLHLYTTPGSAEYSASRALILKGVDGIVFIADADPKSAKANAASLAELKQHLADNKYDYEKVPMVFQLQGTTKQGAVSVDELKRALAIGDRPYFEANPATGVGVFDTLKAVTKLILLELKRSADEEVKKQPAAKQPAKRR